MDIDALRVRLRETPLNFLSAVSSSTLHPFQNEWRSLRESADEALQMSLLNDEDISLVHTTASLLVVWGEVFMKTDEETVKSTILLMNEVEDVFSQLTISNPRQTTPTSRIPVHRKSRGAAPCYIPAAYLWILQNVHDPYPSTENKQRISRDAGRPLRVISDWFKDVRRHMGWVTMCKHHFNSSRALAVQAAKHVYLHADSPRLSLSSDIVSQLEDIRTRLRDMYPVAYDNDDLSDSTDDSFTPSSLSSYGFTSDQSPYARSRSSSSTPSLVFSTDDEDNHSLASTGLDDAPVSLGKRKNNEDDSRLLKRNRSGFISVADRLVEDFVTMPPAAFATLSSTNVDPSLSPPYPGSSPPLRVLKRRLSVSDTQPAPKRPCLPPAVRPRKQAVSTPIPIAYQTTPAVDEWLPFELPDTSLSVELFNWDVVVENDAFLCNSLFDNILQSDGKDCSNATPLLDAYQSPTPLDLSVSPALDPSILDISSTFTELPPTQLTAPILTPSPDPITAATTPAFDFDAFFSIVNAESAGLQSTQYSSSPSTQLSLNDSIDIFGDLGDHINGSNTPLPPSSLPHSSLESILLSSSDDT